MLYVRLLKALCGTIRAALLFLRNLVTHLISQGFELNIAASPAGNHLLTGTTQPGESGSVPSFHCIATFPLQMSPPRHPDGGGFPHSAREGPGRRRLKEMASHNANSPRLEGHAACSSGRRHSSGHLPSIHNNHLGKVLQPEMYSKGGGSCGCCGSRGYGSASLGVGCCDGNLLP